MTYYKGEIVQNPIFEKDYLDVFVSSNGIILDNNDFYNNIFSKAKEKEKEVLTSFFAKKLSDEEIIDKDVLKIIAKYYNKKPSYQTTISIIFELLFDNDGNMYGKEVNTNAIFPVVSTKGYEAQTELSYLSCYIEDSIKGHMMFKDVTTSSQHLLHNNDYYVTTYSFDGGKSLDIKSTKTNVEVRVIRDKINKYHLTLRPIYRHTNMLRFDAPILLISPATQLEFNNNTTIHMMGYSSRIHSYREKSNSNVFKVDPTKLIYSDNKKPENRLNVLNLIDEVELLLIKIQELDSKSYEEYNKEYQDILNNNNNNNNNNLGIDYPQLLQNLINKLNHCINSIYTSNNFIEYLDKLVDDNIYDCELRLDNINFIINKFYQLFNEIPFNLSKNIYSRICSLYVIFLLHNKDLAPFLINSNKFIKDNIKMIYISLYNLDKANLLNDFYTLDEVDINNMIKLIDCVSLNNKKEIKK